MRAICRGRGVYSSDLAERLGPRLNELAGTAPDADGEGRRVRLIALLETSIELLPPDLKLVARVAFGLDARARQRFLRDRLDWLATLIERDARTVRRRLEEAIDLMGEAIDIASPGWYYASVNTLLRLGGPAPEFCEERRVVACGAGRMPVNDSRFNCYSQVPYYAFVPSCRCDEFGLRVHFYGTAVPRALWLMDGVSPGLIERPVMGLRSVEIDSLGLAEVRFTGLQVGSGYGVRWELHRIP